MNSILIAWLIVAAVLVVFGLLIGHAATKRYLGLLIDGRGRFSLTQLQLVIWTIVVLSLIAAVAIGRLAAGVPAVLGFEIPRELLIVMGISVGSTATAATVKAAKDATHPERVAASDGNDKPRFLQVFLLDEGQYADQVVDVTKFQNFWMTCLVVAAWAAVVIAQISSAKSIAEATIPPFSGTFLVLLGISHAGYLAGKLPNPQGEPKGLTVALKKQGALPERRAAMTEPAARPFYRPRHP
ncbi:MAG TPA: hypothetical protein VI356_15745 [Myxococcales bacterium]